jgi:hypothetical protein
MRMPVPINMVDIPLNMVGSNVFGRYPKISMEQTWNMFISDGWLVPYAGHQTALSSSGGVEGRALFNSNRAGKMILIVDDNVYEIDKNLFKTKIGSLETFSGDVFIDENDANQIGICDKKNIYIYNHVTKAFSKASIDFLPGYIAFQDGYFISPDLLQSKWRLSAINNGLSWPAGSANTGLFQTKPDNPVACVRMPGKENQLMVMGSIVTQFWTDVGYKLFPYQKNTGYNIDYGCLSPDTIASGDSFVIWLGSNEKSGLAIMMTSGGDVEQISNDGINFKLSQLKHPEEAYGFLIKIDGHLFYQITFPHIDDNLSYIYDLNTKMFFSLSDEKMNCHIAKQAVFFNGDYYFTSFKDGHLYKMSSLYSTYDGETIPRIRIPKTIRKPDNKPFITNRLAFVAEEGQAENYSYIQGEQWKGVISSSLDFPYKEDVKVGDTYLIAIGAIVADSDPSRTFTNQAFYSPGYKRGIIWNGFNWDWVNDTTMRIDICLSKNGGESFGNIGQMQMNKQAHRKNMAVIWNLGYGNELIPQFRFWGRNRFLIGNGNVSIYS